jgi:diguanylate cyclase (GGDEF)-like protein/PAS domain S-box-containing protein
MAKLFRFFRVFAMQENSLRLFFSVFLFCVNLSLLPADAAAQTSAFANAARKPLTSFSEIFNLSKEQALRGIPIELDATVSYSDPAWGMLFVEDNLGSAFIDVKGNPAKYPEGELIHISAVSGFANGSKAFLKPHITDLHSRHSLLSTPWAIAELDAGVGTSQLVVTEGVLHPCEDQIGYACFYLVQDKKQVFIIVRQPFSAASLQLNGATARVTGVASPRMDKDRRLGAQLFLDNLSQIKVLAPAPLDSSPPQLIQSLHAEDADVSLVRPVHLRGRVMWNAPGRLAIEDASGTLLAGTTGRPLLHTGDAIDLIGFPCHGRLGLEICEATAHLTADQSSPVSAAPLSVSVAEILARSLNGHRVHLRARLDSIERTGNLYTLRFEQQGLSFTAQMPRLDPVRDPAGLLPGADTEITGLALILNPGKGVPAQLLLLIDGPADLQFHGEASWLTPRRALFLLAGMAVCCLIPFIWVQQLRSTVRRQTALHRAQLEKEFRLATKFQRLFERNLAAVYTLRPDGGVTECNPAFLRLLGLDSLDRLAGRSYWEFEIDSKLNRSLKEGRETKLLSNCEASLRRVDGSLIHLLQNISPVQTPEGLVYEITAINITELRIHQAELQRAHDTALHNSLIDALTGLPNRRSFFDSLPMLLQQAQMNRSLAALLFIDLDGFKEINDTLGHAAGDSLLREIAARLRSLVRKADTLARLGGDEFVVALEDLSQTEDANRIARSILVEIGKSICLEEHHVTVGASIGISFFPNDADSPEHLMHQADAAMYAAKRAGKNRVEQYSPELESTL